MATMTLAESAKLCQDQLTAGVIDTLIETDAFFEILPFIGVEGNSLAYNRETTAGDVQFAAVGDTITAKNPPAFTQINVNFTSLLADNEINNMLQATRSSINDLRAVGIASKARQLARTFANALINGTGLNAQFTGLLGLVTVGKTVTAGTDGAAITLGMLDELLDKVIAKSGQVDFITMHSRTIRSYFALLRALGGASINEVVTLPSGRQVPAYRGVPIFKNDHIPVNQTQGNGTNCTTVFAGCLDDGGPSNGIFGIYPSATEMGIQRRTIGELHDKDATLDRLAWYTGVGVATDHALACIKGVNN